MYQGIIWASLLELLAYCHYVTDYKYSWSASCIYIHMYNKLNISLIVCNSGVIFTVSLAQNSISHRETLVKYSSIINLKTISLIVLTSYQTGLTYNRMTTCFIYFPKLLYTREGPMYQCIIYTCRSIIFILYHKWKKCNNFVYYNIYSIVQITGHCSSGSTND